MRRNLPPGGARSRKSRASPPTRAGSRPACCFAPCAVPCWMGTRLWATLPHGEPRQSVAIPQILVRNGRRAAAIAAEAWYRRPAARLQLIGVTGTNGKTTSVILSQHVLSPLWPMGAIGTLGAFDPSGAPVESEAGNLTTPGPIDLQATLAALVDRGAGGVAMEVSSHSLDQGRVEGLIFRAAIFTNLTRDHLDYHETFDAYFAAKARLVGYLADAGLAVINADDAAWARLPRTPRRITFSATLPRADVTARDVRIDAKGAHFTLVTTGGSHPVSLPLLGRFNVANALGDDSRRDFQSHRTGGDAEN